MKTFSYWDIYRMFLMGEVGSATDDAPVAFEVVALGHFGSAYGSQGAFDLGHLLTEAEAEAAAPTLFDQWLETPGHEAYVLPSWEITPLFPSLYWFWDRDEERAKAS